MDFFKSEQTKTEAQRTITRSNSKHALLPVHVSERYEMMLTWPMIRFRVECIQTVLCSECGLIWRDCVMDVIEE